MQTWLVTGGCGFIGSNFIRMVLEKHENVQIINIDALTYAGNMDNLLGYQRHPQYYFEYGNVCDSEKVASIFKKYKIDVVINFAAESHVDRSIETPDVFVKTNVSGVTVLLDAAHVYWQKRNDKMLFLQVSTDEVYGSLSETGSFTESSPLSPSNPYSASKAGGDMIALAYYKTYGIPVCVTRCSNNYGPYQFPEKLIPLMIQNALTDTMLPVYGDGLNVRDWLHVSDHCRALLHVIKYGEAGEVYNIGGSFERKNIDIVKFILRQLDKPESLIEYVPDRLGHDRRYAIDSGKIRSQLRWKPEVDIEAGLKDTVQWYVNNALWLSRIKSGAYHS